MADHDDKDQLGVAKMNRRGEGRGFHCDTSRGRTEPEPICTQSARERDPPNGYTSIAKSQPPETALALNQRE
jgi:hypothetical protein